MAQPPRKLIVHAGMHKTGSTAIQYWLHNTSLPDIHYFKWRNPNHSDLFVLLFEENPQNYFVLSRKGYSREDAMREREKESDGIRRQIENSDKDVFVFSAERISAAPDEAVQRMHDFFSEFFTDIQVYAYARKPSGFMTSMFQQHLKTGYIKFGFGKLWPNYRRRLGRFSRIFGEENVHLRAFDLLVENGIEAVGDFAEWVGISSIPPKDIVRNKSMSAAGVALLYFYRKYIEPDVPAKKRARYDRRVLNMVQKLPGERFHVDLTPDDRQREKAAKDLHWITGRTGFDFHETGAPREGVRVFRTEEDFLDHAASVSHLLLPKRKQVPLTEDAPGRMETTAARFKAFLSRVPWLRSGTGLPWR